MSTTLPERPNLDWYRKAAKKSLRELRARDRSAKLADAQLAVAREHGFASWRKLKDQVEAATPAADPAEFIAAMTKRDLKSLRRLLKFSSALANARNEHGQPMISIAVEHNHPAMVKLLLDHGANPTARYGRSAHTPLSWALMVRSFDAANVLLKAGVKADLYCAAGLNAVDQLPAYFDRNGYAIAGSSQTGSSRYTSDGTLLPSPPSDPVELASDALYAACRGGHPAAVRFLLSKKIDLTFRSYMGGTPLHWAYYSGSREVVDLLLAAGADASARDDVMHARPKAFGLCVTASWGIMTLVKRILRNDPKAINDLDGRGTALHEAARAGQLGIVQTLLKAGANASIRDADGKTAADLATAASHTEVAALLSKAAAKAAIGHPAMPAQPTGHLGFIAFPVADLVRARGFYETTLGATIAPAGDKAIDVLFAGVRIRVYVHAGEYRRQHSGLQFLIKDLDAVYARLKKLGIDRLSEIINEPWGGRVVTVADPDGNLFNLVDDAYGQQLHPPDSKAATVDKLPPPRTGHKIAQWKPIMDAAFTGDAAKIEKLLATGADPNIVSTTPAKYRPLHRAIESKKTSPRSARHLEAVKALLAGGADPALRGTYDQCSALQLAAFGSPEFIPLLIDRFRPFDIFHAAALGDEKRVAALLKKESSLAKARDENQWTPLHYCASSELHHGDPAKSAALVNIAKILLEAGADPMAAWNYDDEWPLRPLYYAAGRADHPAMVELLLQAGADPCDNESIYHASDEGHAACLALFEKYVPPKKLAAECTKCLRTQFHWGHSKGAPWLLAHGADPNSLRPESGNSALHSAAKSGAGEKVIALLLQHGGDPKVKNKEGKTAIELARQAGKNRVVQQFMQRR